MCNHLGMATLIQRKKFDSEMAALDAAKKLNLSDINLPVAKYHARVAEDDEACWLYLTLEGENIPDGLPTLPEYELVSRS